jgi:fatty-acyl-CoA synthase
MSEPIQTRPETFPGGTLSGLLRELAAARGDAEALVYPGFAHGGTALRRSFRDLDAYVDDLARGLVAWGVQPDDRVALWSANLPDWIPLEFALARVGAVLVTVNTALTGAEVAYVLRQSRSRFVLHATCNGSNASSATLDELLADGAVPGLEGRAWLPAHGDDPTPEGRSPDGSVGTLPTLADLVRQGGSVEDATLAARESACQPGDVVNVQYTSGTTGFPKGVMLSHANLLNNALALGDQLKLGPDDRTVLMVPLFHCFGCVVAVLGTFTHGGTLCCLQAFEPTDALRLIQEERCTVLFGVPTMFSAMLAAPDFEAYDSSTLRTGFAAGAPCPVPLMEQIMERLHCPGMSIAYGLTEASPGVAGSRPDDTVEVRCSTIGRELEGVEIRLVDPTTLQDVAHGAEGELWVRGPNVMVGYHDDAEATANAIVQGGWLRTGDLAVRCDDGNLRIVGRAKEIIIRGGENIAPAQVENVLRAHPDVVDAAVVGVPHEHYGEEVAAALVLREGATLDPDAYTALLDGKLASFKIPRHWRAVEALPLTGSGKVQRYKVAEQLAAELGLA